jgi:hypothetical protein
MSLTSLEPPGGKRWRSDGAEIDGHNSPRLAVTCRSALLKDNCMEVFRAFVSFQRRAFFSGLTARADQPVKVKCPTLGTSSYMPGLCCLCVTSEH